uniref:hypothetical protein n=1 Tax=Cupriavidus gilardii TaxID=82541 RepID=UPI002479223E|nr:hypothetical protein [Cupriavidus gilardii]
MESQPEQALRDGIEVTSAQIGQIEPFSHYRIRDSRTGAILITAPYAQRARLRNHADRLDLRYGAVRYIAEPFSPEAQSN